MGRRPKKTRLKQRQLRSMALVVTVCFGGLSVLLYQSGQAVDELLARPIWKEPGYVSGAAALRPGLQTSSKEVAKLLRSAGYLEVRTNPRESQFLRGPDSLLIRDGRFETLVTFGEGQVKTVSPGRQYTIQGVELSGADAAQGPVRKPVSLDAVPQHLVHAVLTSEDRRFFEHPGFDLYGMFRALLRNLQANTVIQGGSTLTQQLAKNLFLSPEKTWRRKFREMFIAMALEQRLSKDEILELYLNQVYFGQVDGVGIGGVDQAARMFFGTTAENLTLAESATLAGIISAPNRYSPIRHPVRAVDRRNLVLAQLLGRGLIDEQSKRVAEALPMRTTTSFSDKQAPWAVDYAIDIFEQKYGSNAGSLGPVRIHTTIDLLLQRRAEEAVTAGLKSLDDQAPNAQAALVAIDSRNGDILAMVGSRDYSESSFNRAVHARRHVGSTVKGLSWMYAYDKDATFRATTPLQDQPITILGGSTPWTPQNYDGQFLGRVPARDAFTQSRNIPAVQIAQMVGFEELSAKLVSLGLTEAKPYPSISLGAFNASPLEIGAAYTVFPGEGRYVKPRILRSIRLPSGREGVSSSVSKWRSASSAAAFLASQDLYASIDEGTGRTSRTWVPQHIRIGGKTGTSDNERDAWFVGFIGDVVVAVWVGFDKGKSLDLTGAQAAAPLWARFVGSSGLRDAEPSVKPDTVSLAQFCRDTNMLATDHCVSRLDAWTRDTYASACTTHVDQEHRRPSLLDKVRMKLFRGEKAKRRRSNTNGN